MLEVIVKNAIDDRKMTEGLATPFFACVYRRFETKRPGTLRYRA